MNAPTIWRGDSPGTPRFSRITGCQDELGVRMSLPKKSRGHSTVWPELGQLPILVPLHLLFCFPEAVFTNQWDETIYDTEFLSFTTEFCEKENHRGIQENISTGSVCEHRYFKIFSMDFGYVVE